MKYVSFIVLISLLSSCYKVKRDCSSFKTGRFYTIVTIDSVNYKSEFTRTKKLQVETYNNKIDSSSVRWINDCEMVYKTINPKRMADQKDIHLKILSTTDSSYVYEYSYVGYNCKQLGIAYKIK